MKPFNLPFILCAAALGATSPYLAAQTLQINYADAFDSADLATCVTGAHPFGDARSCSGALPSVSASAGTTLYGTGHAVYADGIDSQSWASASFGTLKAYSLTTNPGVAVGRNTQGRAASSMVDFITAANSSGSPVTVYNYTVTVHGTLSPWVSLAGVEVGRTSGYVSFSVSPLCFACNNVIDNRVPAVGLADFSYGGSFSVPTGVKFQFSFGLDVWTYVAVPGGTPVTETADYADTIAMHIDGVTPGANTLGLSGFDYATAAVPEPASCGLMALGLVGIVCVTRRRKRLPESA